MKIIKAYAEVYSNPFRYDNDEQEKNIVSYLINIYNYFFKKDVQSKNTQFTNPSFYHSNIEVLKHYDITFQLSKERFELLSNRCIRKKNDFKLQNLINKITWIHPSLDKYYLSGSLDVFNEIWHLPDVNRDSFHPWNQICQFISVVNNDLMMNPNDQFILANEGMQLIGFDTINKMKSLLRMNFDFITIRFHVDTFTALKILHSLPNNAGVSVLHNDMDTYITPSFYSDSEYENIYDKEKLEECFECFKKHKVVPEYLGLKNEVLSWLERVYISHKVIEEYCKTFKIETLKDMNACSILPSSVETEIWVTMKTNSWLAYMEENEKLFDIYNDKDNILKDVLKSAIPYYVL